MSAPSAAAPRPFAPRPLRVLRALLAAAHGRWCIQLALALVVGCGLLVAVSSSGSAAQEAPASASGGLLELVGQTGGTIGEVAAQANRVYTTVGPRLTVLDASDPAQLRPVGSSEPLAGVGPLVPRGDMVYVVAYRSGLRIVDVSDVTHPAEVGMFTNGSAITDIAPEGPYAYVASTDLTGGGASLIVLDLADETHPTQVSAMPLPVSTVAVANGTLFAVGDGLHLLSLADPVHPAEMASIPLSQPSALAIDGDRLYVAAGDPAKHYPDFPIEGTVHVFDISNPNSPTLLGNCCDQWRGGGVAARDSILYVTDHDGWSVWDVADVLHARRITHIDLIGNATALAGPQAFVASLNGIRAYDIRNPAQPAPVGSFEAPWPMRVRGVAATPSHVYVAATGTYPDKGFQNGVGLRVFDTSAVGDPTLKGAYDSTGSSLGVDLALVGDRAYLHQTELGTHVLDVSDPAHPVEVALVPGERSAPYSPGQRYQVRGNQRQWTILDYVNPAHASTVANFPADGPVIGGRVVGQYAYLVTGSYAEPSGSVLRIVDITDPAHPAVHGKMDVAEPGVLADGPPFAVENGRAYLRDQRGRLLIVDVTDVDAPGLLAKRDLPFLTLGMTVQRQCLYMVGLSFDGSYSVRIEDYRDPAHPTVLVDADVPRAWGIAADGDKVLVAADYMGLYMFRWSGAGVCDR